MSTPEKVAIITGASQGIGAGLVEAFVGQGYRVIANSRSIKPSTSNAVLAIAGDIADPSVAERVVGEAIEKFGRVDTLINNAGIFIPKPFTEYTKSDFDNKTSVNLAGFFYVTQQAIRQMVKQKSGHVVNLTTTLVGQPIKGVTAALASLTKGGLDAVTRELAMEYVDQGIRVNAVAPGIIKTPMHSPETFDFLSGFHPMNRMGEIHDIVDAILYLESARFVTGETLHVDGGAHAGRW